LSTTILLERGIDLISCHAHAMRVLALESVMKAGYEPSPYSNPDRDAHCISFTGGGHAVFEAIDMGGGSTLRIKADLSRYGLGEASISMEGPDRVPHLGDGRIDFDNCIARAANAARRITAASSSVILDPVGRQPRVRDDASGIRSFTHGEPDAATTILPDVAAAYIMSEMSRLGFGADVASKANVVVCVRPDGIPYASLRFDMQLDIRDVPALKDQGLAFLSRAARPSMVLSISDDRLHVKPVRMLPAPLDHGEQPMIGLRATAALVALGDRPEGVLTDKAFHAMLRIQEALAS